MKILKYTLSILLVLAAFVSCTKDETRIVFDPANVVASTITVPQAIVLNETTKGENLPAFTWTAAQFGYDAAVTYVVELGLQGTNFSKVRVLGSVNTNRLIIKQSDLQAALDFLGAPLGQQQAVEMRVKASIVDQIAPTVSQVINFNVTTYMPAEKEYAKVWLVGDYCGWNHGNSQFLYDIAGDGKYFEGWVMFDGKAQNGFKITYTGGWNGDDIGTNATAVVNNKIKVEPGGNIGLFNGILMYLKLDNRDQSNRTLELINSLTRIGIVGSATPNQWGSPDVEMTFNPATRVFEKKNVTLAAGEIKFRANDTWDISWGTYDASAGKNPNQLTTANGKNITVAAGTYDITLNLNKVDPTFEVKPVNQ